MRKTRHSLHPDDLKAPFTVTRKLVIIDGTNLTHKLGQIEESNFGDTCCQVRDGHFVATGVTATCIKCSLCRGCYCCRANWIREETMRMGKWVTRDDRKLYPFEMDDVHLQNSIKKLLREEKHFKDNWFEWVEVLEVEAKQRGLR